MSEGIKY